MATKKDYYEVLGVPRSASQDDIKKAYRKMAREHHPDVAANTDKTEAEKRFKEINEAYQVLSDSQKKKMYDQFGHAAFGGASGSDAGAGGPFGGFGGFGSQGGKWGPFTYTYTSGGAGGNAGNGMDFDPFDIFEEVFGFRGFGAQRGPRKGKNLYYELHIDFADAVKGAEKTVNIETGNISIKIPQGARDGTELRFAGKGAPGPQGSPSGDLYISLRVRTPQEFQRVGDNLGTAVEIDFVQATLGDMVEVAVVDENSSSGLGKAKLKIPAGTQHGTQFRLKGKGMPKLRGTGKGDIIVQVFIKMPTRLSRKQKELLEEYGNL